MFPEIVRRLRFVWQMVRIVETAGVAQVTIIFGSFHFVGKFHLLDCSVPLILGMDFLVKVQLLVDFGKKQVAVVHKNIRY